MWLDEVKLFEIINNLLSNALKFTQEGFIELRVQLNLLDSSEFPGAKLDIWVADSGPGIRAGEEDKIFVPFYQGTCDADQRLEGTGLGLSIVKELVRTLRGEIRVERAAGGGSLFHVSLPIKIAASTCVEGIRPEFDSTDAPRRPVLSDNGEFGGRRLLLVDDNELNAMLACRVLEALGFEVELAADGGKAVEAFGKRPFDIVLMDCQMPVMDGYAATRAIRKIEQQTSGRRTPVIAITAYTLAGDRDKCLAAGMDDYLGKPYSVKELRPKLVRWLVNQRVDVAPWTSATS